MAAALERRAAVWLRKDPRRPTAVTPAPPARIGNSLYGRDWGTYSGVPIIPFPPAVNRELRCDPLLCLDRHLGDPETTKGSTGLKFRIQLPPAVSLNHSAARAVGAPLDNLDQRIDVTPRRLLDARTKVSDGFANADRYPLVPSIHRQVDLLKRRHGRARQAKQGSD
ncbi:MAG: hypothetical protein J2P48_09495 [Alphaproteobacteria bacterium]|nr:hypothetical protein [Alphaproteobacteria bacterium]